MAITSCAPPHDAFSPPPDALATARTALTEGLAQVTDANTPRERRAIILLVWLVARMQGAHDLATAARLWSVLEQAGVAAFRGVRLRFNAAGPAAPLSVEE